ncbi:MAG: hypothetical protein GXO39_05130 [Thermotogae bacterium]|nr:hypothetical protein [Thermotogota bacterium]
MRKLGFIFVAISVFTTIPLFGKPPAKTKKLPYRVCSTPSVYIKARIAVNPAGKYTLNFRGNLRTYMAVIAKKAKERILKNSANSVKIVGVSYSETPFGTFSKLLNNDRNAALHRDDSVANRTPYLIDILVGEDSYGIVGKIWLINLQSEYVYEVFKTRVPSTNVRDVLQTIIMVTNLLADSLGDVLTRIALHETMTSLSVAVKPEADISQDKYVAIRVNDAFNYMGKSLKDVLGKNFGVAVRLKPGTPGKITTGEPAGNGWHIVRGENPVILYQPPACKYFNKQNPIKVQLEFKPACPRDNKVLAVNPTVNGRDNFTVKAPYAWKVTTVVNAKSQNNELKFQLNYLLHHKFTCKRYADYSTQYAQTFGIEAGDVMFFSDNFIAGKVPGKTGDKGRVLSVKYTDCGVLDPWKLKDPSIDTVFVVIYGPEKVANADMRYYINGGIMQSSVGSENSIFDLLGIRVVGGDRVKFKDVPVFTNDPLTFEGQKQTFLSFKPFSAQAVLTHTFKNSQCGNETLQITAQSTFTPVIECDCVAFKLKEEDKGKKEDKK